MDEIARRVRRLMLHITQMDGAYYYFSRKLGYKENLLYLLYALDDGLPHSQTEICRDWMIPKTTVNTNVKELVAAGYATLEHGEGREKVIALTERGRAYAGELLGPVYAAERAAMEQTLARYAPAFSDAVAYFSQALCRELEERAVRTEDPSGEGKETV